MAIKKQELKSRPTTKVRFSLSAEEAGGVEKASVVGSFNNWNPLANPMTRNKNGAFSLDMELPKGDTYRFRYYLSGDIWKNDPEADGYEHCGVAEDENSLLHL